MKWWVISETVSPEILTPRRRRRRRRRRTWNVYKFKKAPPLREGPNYINKCILHTFQSINPPHGQWPAPMGSWRVSNWYKVTFFWVYMALFKLPMAKWNHTSTTNFKLSIGRNGSLTHGGAVLDLFSKVFTLGALTTLLGKSFYIFVTRRPNEY